MFHNSINSDRYIEQDSRSVKDRSLHEVSKILMLESQNDLERSRETEKGLRCCVAQRAFGKQVFWGAKSGELSGCNFSSSPFLHVKMR